MVEIYMRGGTADSGTLAALAVVSQANLLGTVNRNIMIKNIKTLVHADFPDVNDAAALVLADPDFTLNQISAGLGNTSITPEDASTYIPGQEEVRRVWDIQPLPMGQIAGDAAMSMIQWKLPPKGVPVLRGRGLEIFIWNMSGANAFSNGPTVVTRSKVMGGFF